MKKTTKKIFIIFLLLSIFVIYFVPFTNVSYNKEGEFQYCRYRLAVYEFSFYESDVSPHSDTYIGKIIFKKKIGGILEYFGVKKITSEKHE